MKEFRRQIPWMDDDASGFGDSYGTHETMVIARQLHLTTLLYTEKRF